MKCVGRCSAPTQSTVFHSGEWGVNGTTYSEMTRLIKAVSGLHPRRAQQERRKVRFGAAVSLRSRLRRTAAAGVVESGDRGGGGGVTLALAAPGFVTLSFGTLWFVTLGL